MLSGGTGKIYDSNVIGNTGYALVFNADINDFQAYENNFTSLSADYALYIRGSNNLFWNNFIMDANSSTPGAIDLNSNLWYNHDQNVGNYWADYNFSAYCTGGQVGVEPYTIDLDSVDQYPLCSWPYC